MLLPGRLHSLSHVLSADPPDSPSFLTCMLLKTLVITYLYKFRLKLIHCTSTEQVLKVSSSPLQASLVLRAAHLHKDRRRAATTVADGCAS